MNKFILLLLTWLASVAQAQVANMPPHVLQRLAEVGPGWGKDIRGNIAKTLEVYTPILAAMPKYGVTVTRDLAYGEDPRHRLDMFRPEGKSGVPVVVFLHGGAYVAGERRLNALIFCLERSVFSRGLSAPQTGICILGRSRQQESAMPRAKKTWGEKMKAKPPHHVVLEKDFAGIPKGAKLHISCPVEVAAELKTIPPGSTMSIRAFRRRLAEKNNCDATCPVSTSLFLRIVAEHAWEEYGKTGSTRDLAPFWRVLESHSPMVKKLSFDSSWIDLQRELES